jgi:Fe-Mn family superoxide dismutase
VSTQCTLPPLPYAYDALEPWCSAETLHLHHDKHHKAYVDGANEAAQALSEIDPAETAKLSGLRANLEFNLGGHVLHSLFWKSLTPVPMKIPSALDKRIAADFGSLERATSLLQAACMGVKGSGWGVLAFDPTYDRLHIAAMEDHHREVAPGLVNLGVIDVWEHAYYLVHKNDRAGWAKLAIEHLDWEGVDMRLKEAWAATRDGASH